MQITLSRLQPLLLRLRPWIDRILFQFNRLRQTIEENPPYVRAFCQLPLLFTWFAGIHSERYRPAAYRGMFLSVMFLAASSLVYFIFDTFRVIAAGSFVVQAIFFLLQAAISLAYIIVSSKMAYSEYRGLHPGNIYLDRWRDRILEYI